jgi:hypothetical protein
MRTMPEALAEGWLIALATAFGPVILGGFYGLMRFLAARWQKPYLAEKGLRESAEEASEEMEAELRSKTDELTQVRVELMFAKERLSWCERQLEDFRSGRIRGNPSGGPSGNPSGGNPSGNSGSGGGK